MATCGYCEIYDEILKNNPNLKLIVFTNDHNTECRCMLEMAQKHGAKTLYVQHSSITEGFPPLHFTYSFLDGMESFEKYKAIGDIKGKIFLTGSPRFDELYDYKNGIKTHDIGIALNMLDSCDKVMELCKYLQEHVFRKILVRPHPRMGSLFYVQRFRKAGFDISNSTAESSFSFLSKVKYLVANESSIHLDSALIGVPSLLYNFSTEGIRDWYSYVKKGMIQVCNSPQDVESVLKTHNRNSTEKIKYYNTSYQTPIEGNIGAFIANFIKKVIATSERDALLNIASIMDKETDYYVIKTC